ncbi:MAG TPA: patatin-like phospholipase family protein [Bacteroidales bacterium]|nr:patatin-like phospholipase family protein [Bacteroidales bacterium]
MKQKVALALGSGGARGLAHIGVIEELNSHGFEITSVSGTSIGSLIGGVFAMGELDSLANWVCTLNKRDVYNLMDFTIGTNGLLKCNKVISKMKTFIPDMNIEEMNIPYSAIATDIINRKEVVFTSGSFYDATRASIAIPSIITPAVINNKILVDGGIINPIPVNRVKRNEGDILVAVNLYYSDEINELKGQMPNLTKRKRNGFFEGSLKNRNLSISLRNKILDFIDIGDKQSQGYYTLIQLASSTMLERISDLSLEITKPDIIINIPVATARSYDFHRSNEIIEVGRHAAALCIKEFNNKETKL